MRKYLCISAQFFFFGSVAVRLDGRYRVLGHFPYPKYIDSIELGSRARPSRSIVSASSFIRLAHRFGHWRAMDGGLVATEKAHQSALLRSSGDLSAKICEDAESSYLLTRNGFPRGNPGVMRIIWGSEAPRSTGLGTSDGRIRVARLWAAEWRASGKMARSEGPVVEGERR